MQKKVILLLPSLTIGGAEKQALFYAKTIQENNLGKVKIIGLGKEGALIPELNKLEIEYDSFKFQYLQSKNWIKKTIEFLKFILFLKKEKASVCIAFTYWPNVLGGAFYKYAGIKHFYWNQRSVDAEMGFSLLEKLAVRNKIKYLSNSETTKQFIINRHKLDKTKVTIVPNYIKLPNEVSRKLSDEFKMIMLANFYPEKDHKTVLLALKKLVEKYPESKIQLTLIGKAPGISPALVKIKALAFDLKLQNYLVFQENSNLEILSTMSLGILSSFSEGCSNTLLEYMVYELPVAATGISANRELISDLDQLFSIEDVEGLAIIMENNMNNPSLFEEKGIQNRKFIQGKFDTIRTQQLLQDTLH